MAKSTVKFNCGCGYTATNPLEAVLHVDSWLWVHCNQSLRGSTSRGLYWTHDGSCWGTKTRQ